MQAASKSPIFSHFSETQVGVSTIRAFNGQQWAVKSMEDKINEYLVYYYCNIASNRWLALRLEFVSLKVIFFKKLIKIIKYQI
jgi:hypothetical protein